MKHIISLIFALSIAQVACAQWHIDPCIQINGLGYYLYDDTHEAMVADGNTWEGVLEIPSTVTYDGKDYTVTTLAMTAFSYCETLTGVVIPETVRGIERLIPNQQYPFLACKKLEFIKVKEGNQWLCSDDSVLYSKDKKTLYSYPVGHKRTTYTIPDGVEYISAGAFAYNTSLTSVVIPNSVHEIYMMAFEGCDALKEVTLPNNLTVIRDYSFQLCNNLETIKFPENLIEIKKQAFSYCSSIRLLDLPASIKKFEDMCFWECSLDTLVIRGTLESNLSGVFSGMLASPIVYVPQSEIDKYKAIYSGTVLPLTSYHPNSIQNLQMTKQSPSPATLYDLSGRRLSAPPAKGLFIRDGQKVMR